MKLQPTPRLLLNRIQTPDGTILTSRHRHDYVTYTDANGLEYMVDGGLEYLRRTEHKTKLNWYERILIYIIEVIAKQEYPDPLAYKELSVYSDAPFEQIREQFEWGSRGKYGNLPLRYTPLKNLSARHINAILINQKQIPLWLRQIFLKELAYREMIKANKTLQQNEQH